LLSDNELLGRINDVFFENIDTPSDYSHFCFSTGPFSSNCSIVHSKEVSDDSEHLEESDTESILNVISELNRSVLLYLINASDFKLINESAGSPRLFSDISPFPIDDISGSCLDVAEFE
jgi:hypothetical protein